MKKSPLHATLQLSMGEYIDAFASLVYEHYQRAMSDDVLFQELSLSDEEQARFSVEYSTVLLVMATLAFKVKPKLTTEKYRDRIQQRMAESAYKKILGDADEQTISGCMTFYETKVKIFSQICTNLSSTVSANRQKDVVGFARYLADKVITPSRRTYVHVTVYEEVGHGGAASVPEGVTEAISVDMGCVGEGLSCTERQTSICAKDSGGPYSYQVVGKLIDAAKRMGADYAVDVYPHYGSDVEVTLHAGHDIRHGLIGAGVYASHGYERSHIDGVYNTLKVLCGYLNV